MNKHRQDVVTKSLGRGEGAYGWRMTIGLKLQEQVESWPTEKEGEKKANWATVKAAEPPDRPFHPKSCLLNVYGHYGLAVKKTCTEHIDRFQT